MSAPFNTQAGCQMTKVFSLVGWSDFQHYKNDTPAWIKLHGTTLTSLTWIKGSERDRMIMVACMMLAARYGNKIPFDFEILQPVAALKCSEKQMKASLDYLEASGFIEIGSRETLERHETKNRAGLSLEEEEKKEDSENTPQAPEGVCVKTEEFAKVYAAYPLKNAPNRAAKALSKVLALGVTLPVILEGIERYKKTKPADTKWAHLATWLDDGRWQDEGATMTQGMQSPEGMGEILLTDDFWRRTIPFWQKTKIWPKHAGPEYGYGGCKVPPNIIEEFNLDGMTPPNHLARNVSMAG